MLLVLPGRLIAHWDLWCSLECTSACQAEGRGFKSRQVRKRYYRWGRVAQLVERAPEKREVTGSTPVSTTDSLLAIHLACFAFSLIGAFPGPSDSSGVWSSDPVRVRDCCQPGIDPIRAPSPEVVNVAGLSCRA